jgi:hypothetical protein
VSFDDYSNKAMTPYTGYGWSNKSMAKTITIVNKSSVFLGSLAPGNTTVIKCDDHGTPLDRYWRNRMRDAKQDGCIEVVQLEAKAPAKSEPKPSKGAH